MTDILTLSEISPAYDAILHADHPSDLRKQLKEEV